jgi:hypothetical protein
LACGRGLLVLCSWPCSPGLGFAVLSSRSSIRGIRFLSLASGPRVGFSKLSLLSASLTARPVASISWSWSWRRVLGLVGLGSRSYLLGLDDHLWVAVLTSRSRLRPLGSGASTTGSWPVAVSCLLMSCLGLSCLLFSSIIRPPLVLSCIVLSCLVFSSLLFSCLILYPIRFDLALYSLVVLPCRYLIWSCPFI